MKITTRSIEDYTSGANRLFQEIIYKRNYGHLKKVIKPWRGEDLADYEVVEGFTALPLVKSGYQILKEETYSVNPSRLTLLLGIFCNEQNGENYLVKERYIAFRVHYQKMEVKEVVDLDGLLSDVSLERPLFVGQAAGEIDFAIPYSY
ncbi:MAG: hypothetical protein ABIA37_03675 [Candidatus Woesearchaeota archaeon]